MEIVAILRLLRRHRVYVAAGLLAATMLGLVLTYHVSLMPPRLGSRQQVSGVATARVIIAARNQPAFDLKSQLTETLGTRATLLADLLSTDPVQGRIARTAGLEPGQVAVVTPAMGPPPLAIALALSATEAAATPREPYLLTVTTQGQIPIISLRAAGPDAVRAARVANAATETIGALIASRSAGRPDIVVERLGPALARTVVQGPRRAIAAGATLLVLGLWCTGIVIVAGLARRLRQRLPPSPVPAHSSAASAARGVLGLRKTGPVRDVDSQ
jgi:hypothetical protein